MKVCQLCAVDFTLYHFLLPLIDGMHGLGWEVTSVCSDGPTIPVLRERGYRIETIEIARSMNPLRNLLSVVSLVRLFQRERFDILHVHTPVAAFLGRIAAKIAGVPCVVYTVHGFYFHDEMPRWKRLLFISLERVAGYWTDFLLTQSEEDARMAVAEGIVPIERVQTIGNGVDSIRFDPVTVGDGSTQREALGIPQDAPVVGMISRLVREKGVMEFLAAATLLAARFPNVWFLLVGERLASDHAAGVEAEIVLAQRKLGQRLVLTGLRRDMPEIFAVIDVFCLPSWREGMPRTIIEAMMMGKPVVATDIRGSREEVVPELTGLLVPTRQPEILAKAIGRCLADAPWAKKLGERGRERARKIYDERVVVELQLMRIGELVRNKGIA